MNRRSFLFVFGTLSIFPAGLAQTPYSVTDLCAPATCRSGSPILNDNGAIAGVYLNSTTTFALYPGQPPVNINQQTGLSQIFQPAWMNSAGIIAGSLENGEQSEALVYLPGGQLFDLNPVFGWATGFATYISDTNRIVGEGSPTPSLTIPDAPPCPGLNFVPGVQCVFPYIITDSGTVVAEDLSKFEWFVYSPATGITYLNGFLAAYNGIGHVITTSAGPNTTYMLYTPEKGQVLLPLGVDASLLSLNNSDQLVVNTTPLGTNPFFYSAATGLVPLSSLVSPASGWTFNSVYAINNRGQILAEGVNEAASRTTLVLLTPASLSPSITGAPTASEVPALRTGMTRAEPAACGAFSWNTVSLGRLCRGPADRARVEPF
jgi:hypothetical protein